MAGKRLSGFDDERRFVCETPIWRERDELLRSVPGVGKVLSTSLLAHLPSWGALNRKQIAALAGLAPFNRDSGNLRRSRCIWVIATRSGASCIWPSSLPCVPIQ